MAKGRKTGGRVAGTPNKTTVQMKEAAQAYAPQALAALVKVMQFGESEMAKIAACREILDRACGKPAQASLLEIAPKSPVAEITVEERRAVYRALYKEFGALGG